VLGLEEVLRPVLCEQVEASTISTLPLRSAGLRLAQHEDAGGKAGAVEEVGRQADHRLDQVVLQQVLADLALDAAAEERALRQHHGHAPAAGGHRLDHVLHPGEVAVAVGG
jgi:hypothetical protein